MGVPPPFGRATHPFQDAHGGLFLAQRQWLAPARSDRWLRIETIVPWESAFDTRQQRAGYLHIRTKLVPASESGIFS